MIRLAIIRRRMIEESTVFPDARPGTFFALFYTYGSLLMVRAVNSILIVVEESRCIATRHAFPHIHMVAGM